LDSILALAAVDQEIAARAECATGYCGVGKMGRRSSRAFR